MPRWPPLCVQVASEVQSEATHQNTSRPTCATESISQSIAR